MTDCLAREWIVAPSSIHFAENEIHIYRVFLDQPPGHVHWLTTILAPGERERAQRFHFERDRQRYVVGRASLRMLLARYVGAEPQSLEFQYGRHGKPELAAPRQASLLSFNVAHSEGIALYAVTRNHVIGADIERVRSLVHFDLMAELYFAAEERVALQGLSMPARQMAFFTCWTRKEAFMKALGLGMSIPLDSFAVSVAPTDSARLLRIAGSIEDAARWSLYALTPDSGFVATVAVQGPPTSLRLWSWSP
ncbi:MAG TPA: 4'-phosphopantetheinyl transferase superfamily protein [Ktedonobacterales bacterium]|nr:4'-phosphopantetheinyl transferase superfamily protein [Ktedonobacterales bacterium]